MPLLQVLRNRPAPPGPAAANTYAATAINLGVDRLYVFDELTGTNIENAANPGVNDLGIIRTTNIGFLQGIVGPVRGTPRVKGMGVAAQGRTFDDNAPLTGYVGVIGGFFQLGNRQASSADNILISCTYDTNTQRTWWLGVYTPGAVVLYCEGAGNGYRWVWNDPAVIQQFKRDPSDTYVDGSIWNFMAVVQRGDGTGPKLWLNGTEYAYDARIVIGAGAPEGDDYYLGHVHDDVLAVDPTAVAQVRICDPQARGGVTPSWFQTACGVFMFDGTSLSSAQIDSIYQAANLSGLVSDYMEYVAGNRSGPNWWMGPQRACTGTDPAIAMPILAQNLSDTDHVSATSWPVSTSERLTGRDRALPVAWSTDYQKIGTNPDTTGASSERVANANSWTVANGFDEGTICVLARMDATADRWLLSIAGGLGSGPSVAGNRLNIRTISGNKLRVDRAVSFNDVQTEIDLTGVLAPGQDAMLVFVMRKDGNPMEVYANGSSVSVTETVDPGADPEMWLGEMCDATISGAGTFSLSVGYANGQPALSRKWPESIYDAWISREPWSVGEIQDAWDLLNGNITSATVT